MKLTIGLLSEYLERFGISTKITREKTWVGDCFFEKDCIKLVRGNRSICIKPWETLGRETIFYDEDNKEHKLSDLNLEVDTLHVATCITNGKKVWPPYDSHSCFSKSYEDVLKTYIIEFLNIIQITNTGELFEQQTLF